MRRSSALPVVALVLALTACSSPAAKVGSLSTEVALAASGGDPKVIEEVVDAHADDVVTTDADGLAELTFADGSLTRLGPDTEYTVVEVSDAQTQRTIGSLDVGSTFHRVEKLVGDDSVFEVETPFGTAAVRGTIFAVTCTTTACEIVVLEGEVEFTPEDGDPISIMPFQRLVVPEGDAATAFPADAVAADEWLSSNLERDETELDAIAADVPGAASLVGVWAYRSDTIESTDPDEPVGTVQERDWTFAEPDCSGTSCVLPVESTSGGMFQFEYLDGSVTYSSTGPLDCVNLDTLELMAADAYTRDITFTIDSVSPTDGVLTGTRTIHTYLVDFVGCENPNTTDVTATADVTLTRK